MTSSIVYTRSLLGEAGGHRCRCIISMHSIHMHATSDVASTAAQLHHSFIVWSQVPCCIYTRTGLMGYFAIDPAPSFWPPLIEGR